MNSTRSRTLANLVTAGVFTAALVGGGASVAHAEMMDPPVQAQVETDLSIGAIPFNSIGSVPAGVQGTFQMTGVVDNGQGFLYTPIGGGSVSWGQFERLNDLKGGTCHMLSDDSGVVCQV